MAAPCDNKSHFHKTVILDEWWLIWAEDDNRDKKLAIAGETSQGQRALRVFSSFPILRRHDSVTLETTDGIYVKIVGFLNKTRTEENGFPSEVFKCFSSGFPPHWEVCAKHYLAQGFAGNDVSREDASLKGSSQTIEECNTNNVESNVTPVRADPKLDEDQAVCPIRESSQIVTLANMDPELDEDQKKTADIDRYIIWAIGAKDTDQKKTADIDRESSLKENAVINESSTAEEKTSNSEDASLSGCSNASEQTNEMNNTIANVSLVGTSPELDQDPQDPAACINLEGSENSDETVKYITRACGAKDTHQRRTADIEMENNLKENAAIKDANIVGEKTYDNVSSEDASFEGCGTASEQIIEMTNTEANASIANSVLELDQDHTACMIPKGSENSNEAVGIITRVHGAKDADQRKTAVVEKESIMEENTASRGASTAGKKTCTDASRRFKESSNKSNKAVRCRTRSGCAGNTDCKRTATVKKENTLIGKAASKDTSTPKKNTKRKLTYVGSPVTPKADVTASFISPELSSVKRSRSGRLLLPTLEYWRNQTAVYDPDHQVIGIKDDISTPSRAELTPKRSEGRAKSKKDPNAASEKLTHEPRRGVGRPRSVKSPAAVKEKELKSSRRR